MVTIPMACLPPDIDNILLQLDRKIHRPSDWFQRELLKSVNFVLDTEADSSFPADSRGYSYHRKPWPHTQFIHRSGATFVQILPECKGFWWVKNRLYSNSGASKSSGASVNADSMRAQFEELCGNAATLQAFWESCENRLRDSLAMEQTGVGNVCTSIQ